MSYYVSIVLVLVLCLYFGRTFGLYIHCENCAELNRVKCFAFLIPFMSVSMVYSFFKEGIKTRSFKLLWGFMRIPSTDICFVLCRSVWMK